MKNVLRPLRTTVPAPAVTVAMSMRNASRFLRECIDSVLSQSFTDFEFLIVDDGSTDDSVRIVRSYSDPRIRLICRPHDFIASLNTLLDEARGRYIARMDNDDVMMPHRLQIEYDYLEAHPDVSVVASDALTIDAAGLITGRISPYQHETVISTRDMCESNRICNPTSMIRNADLKRWPLRYDSSFLLANDFKLSAEMLLLGLKIVHLPDPLIKYRNFDGQATTTHWDEMEQEGRDVMAWLSSAVAIKANPGYADPVIEKTGHELTLIIPFLNEGEEVEATVRSFREFGGDRMDVIVINDCSYDSYPYMERLRAIPGVTYIFNRQRLGVAACRDKGVALCRTPYFLLLDAHMRAYDDSWLNEIPRLLRENDRQILCCQTKPLKANKGGAAEYEEKHTDAYGCRMIFSPQKLMPGIEWVKDEREPGQPCETIQCVMGAGYACSKRYWEKIDGLRGLEQYGCDEQMMSLKTWLEGGRCLLLKQVRLGHIYRSSMPYEILRSAILHNYLLISETLFPVKERCKAQAAAYLYDRDQFLQAFLELKDFFVRNQSLRTTYAATFTRPFCEIVEMNRIASVVESQLINDIQSKLADIAIHSTHNDYTGFGLYEGAIGRALWLLTYSASINDVRFEKAGLEMLSRALGGIDNSDYTFSTGIAGIGWAMSYLASHHLAPIGADDFEYVDKSIVKHISSIDPANEDISLDGGLAGIMAYCCTRIMSQAFDEIGHLLDNVCSVILASRSPSANEVFYALLWQQLRQDPTKSDAINISVTDWAKPNPFIPRDCRYWNMSLFDGVLSSSISIIQ